MSIHKSVDSTKRLFDYIWKELIYIDSNDISWKDKEKRIIKLISQWNYECNEVSDDIPGTLVGRGGGAGIYIPRSSIVLGGKKYPIVKTGVTMSFKGKFDWYDQEVVFRSPREGNILDLKISKDDNKVLLSCQIGINDILISGLLSHLYDMGNCPHVLKQHGIYVCPMSDSSPVKIISDSPSDKDNVAFPQYQVKTIFEKSSMNWYDLVNSDELLMGMDPFHWYNLIFQYIFTMRYLQQSIGLNHMDPHLKNMMITFHDSPSPSLYLSHPLVHTSNSPRWNNIRPIKMKYQSHTLSKVPGMIYTPFQFKHQGKNVTVYTVNSGCMFKLIDPELSTVDLSDSLYDHLKIPIEIRPYRSQFDNYLIQGGTLYDNKSQKYTGHVYNVITGLITELYYGMKKRYVSKNTRNESMASITQLSTLKSIIDMLEQVFPDLKIPSMKNYRHDKQAQEWLAKTPTDSSSDIVKNRLTHSYSDWIYRNKDNGAVLPTDKKTEYKDIILERYLDWMITKGWYRDIDEDKRVFVIAPEYYTLEDVDKFVEMIQGQERKAPVNSKDVTEKQREGQREGLREAQIKGRRERPDERIGRDEMRTGRKKLYDEKREKREKREERKDIKKKQIIPLIYINPSPKNMIRTDFLDFITAVRNIKKSQCTRKNTTDKCKKLFIQSDRYDRNSLLERSIVSNTITSWDPRHIYEWDELSEFETLDFGDHESRITSYYMQINPEILGMDIISDRESPKFKHDYPIMYDFKYPSKELVGKYIPSIFLHIVKLKGPLNINTSIGQSLYESSRKYLENKHMGISVNGPYYIVNHNIKNPLTPGLDKYLNKPIGFYFDENNKSLSGTYLSVPLPYAENFAVITLGKDDLIHMYRYIDFINIHRVDYEKINYEFTKKGVYSTTQPVIRMKDNEPLLLKGKRDYKLAFCGGPILIWDGEIIMNEDLLNEKLLYDPHRDGRLFYEAGLSLDLGYIKNDRRPNPEDEFRLVPHVVMEKGKPVFTGLGAQTSFKFKAQPGDSIFPYGQRHSNLLQIHNIMALDIYGNTIFFLLEGRGYDSPGLTRPQLTELISRFQIIHAVSMDGGYSAGVVIKSEPDSYIYLLDDPAKRDLGMVMHINI